MAKENHEKKKKQLSKKQVEEIPTKVRKLKKKKAKKEKVIQNESDADTDPDPVSDSGETTSEKMHRLLEPYTKEQLIDFIIDAASKDNALYTRIRDAADSDASHRKIFVYGLGWDATREAVESAFSSYGEIEDCTVVTDRATGRAKGFGFVMFKTRKGATKALKEPKKQICNRMVSCQLASLGKTPNQQQIQDTAGRKIYISNVPKDADPEKLKAIFAKFGEIETGPIGFDSNSGKSRGFALFVYKTVEGARKALQEPNKLFDGQPLFCKMAIDNKNKAGGAASVTTALYPIPAAAGVTEMNHLGLLNQYPNFNPMYSSLGMDPNSGLIGSGSVNPLMGAPGAAGFGQGMYGLGHMAQMGGAPVLGSYGMNSLGGGSFGLNSLGGNQSVLGSYGLNSSQATYRGSQTAPTLSGKTAGKAAGDGGSFGGYSSLLCWKPNLRVVTGPLWDSLGS